MAEEKKLSEKELDKVSGGAPWDPVGQKYRCSKCKQTFTSTISPVRCTKCGATGVIFERVY